MLSKKIGIDMGTSSMVIYVKGDGVVVSEPALLASDETGVRVLAVGTAARDLLRREAGRVRGLRPVRDGSVADFRVAGIMLQHFIARVCGRQRIFRPDVMLSVTSGVTGVERRALLEATMVAGAKTAYLIEKLLAAAIGANLSITTTPGLAVAHLGAGATEVAVISAGEMVASERLRVGGAGLDAAIAETVGQDRGVAIDEQEAERLKIGIGSAVAPASSASMEAAASDRSGRPLRIAVAAVEVHTAMRPHLEAMGTGIARLLEQTPTGLRAAVRTQGLVLTGGGAQLRGLVPLMSGRLGLPVRVAAQPQACVAIGAGMALENMQVLTAGQHYIR